jgi:hypothetical protein
MKEMIAARRYTDKRLEAALCGAMQSIFTRAECLKRDAWSRRA